MASEDIAQKQPGAHNPTTSPTPPPKQSRRSKPITALARTSPGTNITRTTITCATTRAFVVGLQPTKYIELRRFFLSHGMMSVNEGQTEKKTRKKKQENAENTGQAMAKTIRKVISLTNHVTYTPRCV